MRDGLGPIAARRGSARSTPGGGFADRAGPAFPIGPRAVHLVSVERCLSVAGGSVDLAHWSSPLLSVVDQVHELSGPGDLSAGLVLEDGCNRRLPRLAETNDVRKSTTELPTCSRGRPQQSGHRRLPQRRTATDWVEGANQSRVGHQDHPFELRHVAHQGADPEWRRFPERCHSPFPVAADSTWAEAGRWRSSGSAPRRPSVRLAPTLSVEVDAGLCIRVRAHTADPYHAVSESTSTYQSRAGRTPI